ncbi:MAG: TniQ family protein [Blastocatellia bacterium]|nr:TniQ family protein [Blastocatellia bacterium]
MMNLAPPRYEAWDLRLPSLTPRTALAPLAPQGMGTPLTEGLTSFLARLAYTHRLSVGDLLLHYYLPQLRKERGREDFRRAFDLHKMVAANGADTLARDLVDLTERCTGQSQLKAMTLICWEAVVPRLDLLRPRRAWCAACYAAQAAAGHMPWDALCWMLRPVRVCPRHQQPLREQCPQCQRRSVPVLQRYLPGWCAHCGSWLGAATTGAAPAVGEDEEIGFWMAEQCGAVLAATPQLSAPPVRENVVEAVRHCCEEWLEGHTNWLARLLQVADSSARWWYTGRNLPPLRLLAQLSYWTKVPLLHFLLEPAAVSQGLRHAPPPPEFAVRKDGISQLHRRNPVACEKVRAHMEAALQELPPPSLAQVAARLGYRCATTLWCKFPELSNQLSARRRAAVQAPGGRQAASTAAWTYPTEEQLRELLEQEIAAPAPRSPLRLGQDCGYYNSAPLRRKFPALYQALLAQREVRRAEALTVRRTQCRQALEIALLETPPPTLKAVAYRVVGVETGFLRQHFAELCDRLAARRQTARAARIKVVGDTLQQALATDPPRSLHQLAHEVGYHFTTLTIHFPELCRALIERFATAARQRTADKEQAKVLYTVDS